MAEQAPAIGIDLGTTNSCVAVFQNGQVEIIPNDLGMRMTPSCVAFTDFGSLIGESDHNLLSINSSKTVYDAKRLIGRRFDDPYVQADLKHWPFTVINHQGKCKIQVNCSGEDKFYFPEEILALILLKMKETAEAYLGKVVSKAVISVPAYFNDYQRRATKDAATIAGLQVLRLLNEPSAAALTYGFLKMVNSERNILIYDLGGGTFDASVMTFKDGIFHVKSTTGDTHLGGRDFDSRMVDHFAKEFQQKYGRDLYSDKTALGRLRTACEDAKKALSSSVHAQVVIDSLMDGISFNSSITRSCFEELNDDLFRSTLEIVNRTIKEAGIDEIVHDVILVGGSTRIPKIQKFLHDLFYGEKELKMSINPEEAVVYGTAVQAAILQGIQSHSSLKDLKIKDVTPHSLGYAGASGIMRTTIERNSSIPLISLIQDDRFIEETLLELQGSSHPFLVYEGECITVKGNRPIGRLDITDISTIQIMLGINADGIVRCQDDMQEFNRMNEETLYLSKEEVVRLSKEMERYRLEMIQKMETEKVKADFESYCRNVRSSLEKGLKECNGAISWLASNQRPSKDAVEQKKEEIIRLLNEVLISSQGSGSLQESSGVVHSSKRPRTQE